MEGWYKDKDGNIRDPQGYIWHFSGEIETEKFPIEDRNEGGERILRFFNFFKPPHFKIDAYEIYKMHERFIKESLVNSGLTTDDNYPPLIFDEGKRVLVRIVAKISKVRPSKFIYEGMHYDEGAVKKIDNAKIVAHKPKSAVKLLKNGGTNYD